MLTYHSSLGLPINENERQMIEKISFFHQGQPREDRPDRPTDQRKGKGGREGRERPNEGKGPGGKYKVSIILLFIFVKKGY